MNSETRDGMTSVHLSVVPEFSAALIAILRVLIPAWRAWRR